LSATEAEIGSLTEGYGHLFRRAHSLFCDHYNAHFEREGVQITPVLGGMLILIDEHPGLNQIELARLMRIEGSSMWQHVARLTEFAYVQRRRSEHDRRGYTLHLSARGRDVLALVRKGMKQHQRVLLSALSGDERRHLRSMLLRLIDHGERSMSDSAAKSNRLGREAARPPTRAGAQRAGRTASHRRGERHA
jgi:DNA-binding MarR family transcriptional regulator